MPPQSRGPQRPNGFSQSKSSPNLMTIKTLTRDDLTRHSYDRDRDRDQVLLRPSSPYLNPVPDDLTDDDVSTDEDDEDVEDHEGREGFPPLNDDEREELYTTRSHPHLPPSASQLFPPFYNRPPTPLPPSPSLTSLLRPSFSTHTSHHTTPDSSDTEAHSTPAFLPTDPSHKGGSGVTPSVASAPSGRPRAPAPLPYLSSVPTYEYYGFALYLASSVFFLMYTLWAYLPSPFLHQLGIYYYPNRWWALAIPCWLVVLVGWIYVALQSYNTGSLTLRMGDVGCVVDEAGHVACLNGEGEIIRKGSKSRFAQTKREGGGRRRGNGVRKQRSRQSSLRDHEKRAYVPADLGRDVQWRELWNEGTDAVMDVPLGGVCEILYGEGRVPDGYVPDSHEE